VYVYDKPALKNSVTYKCISAKVINKCSAYDKVIQVYLYALKEMCYLQVY
jgi:hypothetical protein